MGSLGPNERTISLPVLDYEKLANKDADEVRRLLEASSTRGMFYLDLRGPRTATIFEDVPTFFAIGNKFFHLPADHPEKEQSLRTGVERGYHRSKSNEYYEIARDDFKLGKWTFPATIEPQKDRVVRALETMNSVAQTMLAELCTALNLTIPELDDDPRIPSDTGLKMLYKPPIHEVGQVVVGRHTDFGLLTLLWYDEVTTELPFYENGKETDQWGTVPVVEGTILVNVADSLAAKSDGRLHSTVHRVVCPPGPKRPKNGLSYLLRPYTS